MARNSKKATVAAAPQTEEKVSVAAAEAETTASVEPVQLTVADLQLLAQVVNLASRRGAFQASELSQVGDVYNKLAGFLAYVESVQKSEEAAEQTPEAAQSDTPAA